MTATAILTTVETAVSTAETAVQTAVETAVSMAGKPQAWTGSQRPTYEARECPSCTGVGFYTVRDGSRPVRGRFAPRFAARFAGAKNREISLQNVLGEHVGNREV